MDKDKTSIERIALLATSIVGGIGVLFTAINSLSNSVRKTVGIFAGFNQWQLGVAALALAGASWWLFRLSRRCRSVLLRPEALRLERANPAHLFGGPAREDIDQLVRLCREEPLVFLEGKSGAGKSALLQAELVPALKGHPGLLPIYVESLAGSDWERDPRIFLVTALWSALDDVSRERMELKAAPAANVARAALETVSETLGRTPLVLLDQFDDYQLRHHERCLARKTWLKPGKLAELNGFWRDLRELVASGSIHLVVVTRTDTAAGLTSVRFAEPETYRLDRLNSLFVGPLLAELAKDQDGQKVIGDPDYGWTSLQTRALGRKYRAIRNDPTAAAQDRARRARHPAWPGVDGRGIRARRRNRWPRSPLYRGSDRQGRAAVWSGRGACARGPADPGRPDNRPENRGTPYRGAALRHRPERAGKSSAGPRRARARGSYPPSRRSGGGQNYWLLDHDYLARAVREADRRANRWQRALAEGAKALADAGARWTRRWRALLPPTTQLGFLRDRLRSKSAMASTALTRQESLQRFGPTLAVFLLVAAVATYENGKDAPKRGLRNPLTTF